MKQALRGVDSVPVPKSDVLFRSINTVAIALVIAAFLWTASTLTNLNTKVAVLISQNDAVATEFVRIDRRLTALERHSSMLAIHGLIDVTPGRN